MSNSSLSGGRPAAPHPDGKDVDSLGPSDSSDSGSDVQGEPTSALPLDLLTDGGLAEADRYGDSDASGTGERAAAGMGSVRDAADISPDRIVSTPDESDGDGTENIDLDAIGDGVPIDMAEVEVDLLSIEEDEYDEDDLDEDNNSEGAR